LLAVLLVALRRVETAKIGHVAPVRLAAWGESAYARELDTFYGLIDKRVPLVFMRLMAAVDSYYWWLLLFLQSDVLAIRNQP
jgi:hypothetical protein